MDKVMVLKLIITRQMHVHVKFACSPKLHCTFISLKDPFNLLHAERERERERERG